MLPHSLGMISSLRNIALAGELLGSPPLAHILTYLLI